jgi:hypothetical protein
VAADLLTVWSQVYLVNVRRSCSDRRVHAYHKLYVVWGRKPTAEEVETKARATAANTAAAATTGGAAAGCSSSADVAAPPSTNVAPLS